MARQITIEEVKKHKRKNSVWMIIHDDVYDVTRFLNEHPGGEDTLLEYAGKDGTQAFEDVHHSEDAREIMKKFKIGTLPPDQRNKSIVDCCKWRSKKKPSQSQPIKSGFRRTFDQIRQDRNSRRVSAINVPRESTCRPRGYPCDGRSYTWVFLALAGAIALGVVWKKYLSK
nr:cytochrome b5-like isoform X3 [Danaus plexippus plexippus]